MFRSFLICGALIVAAPALAQDAPAGAETLLPDPNDNSDSFTIAAGGAFLPDYEGSNEYRLIPAAALRGRVSGISFFTRGTYLYADFIPRGPGKIELDAGPIVGVRLNRTGKVEDAMVKLLPDRKAAIEVGGFAGITAHGLSNPYDALSLRVDVVKDVGNAHQSTVITPTIDFGTPLSRHTYVGLSASADWVGGDYADYYFGITPADALASGLPVFNPKGGMKNWKLAMLANQSLTGDLLGGWSLFGTASYSKLVGDFKRSPIVSQRGSSGQWLVAGGVAYTF